MTNPLPCAYHRFRSSVNRLFAEEAAYDPLLLPYRLRADRIMVAMNAFLTVICLLVASLYGVFMPVLFLALPWFGLSIWLVRQYGGSLMTRLTIACGFMMYTGLIIHQTQGDIEAHFSAFGLIGVLLYYRDWRVILTATLFIYAHHLILGYAQQLGAPVYVFDEPHFSKLFIIHVLYFLPFIAMMLYLSIWLRRDGYEDQHVIALARKIVQGNLVEGDDIPESERQTPLIAAVLMMKNRLLDLLRVMPVAAAVIRIDSQTIVSVNQAWIQTIGTLEESSDVRQAPIWVDPATWQNLLEQLREASDNLLDKVEVMLKRSDGDLILCELSLILHDDIEPVMAILTIEDVTQRRQAQRIMEKLAYRDGLTDLPNRTSFQYALENAVQAWIAESKPFALVMMDLDGFKPVNDRYGHDAGDTVLQVVGARMQQINRKADMAARLGGDEFVMLLRDCPSPQCVVHIAQRVIDAIARPIALNDDGKTQIQVGASAGVAYSADHDLSAETITKLADIALYQAKAAGKNRVALYSPYG